MSNKKHDSYGFVSGSASETKYKEYLNWGIKIDREWWLIWRYLTVDKKYCNVKK